MILYIAEKPSLARALATALPSAINRAKNDGYIELEDGSIISWCIGHLLELAAPEHYNPEFKKWRLEHLPIVPSQWRYQPKKNTRKQLTILTQLIKKASSIVHVGDPDREGQLLVDEVLTYAGASQPTIRIQRLLINDLNTSAIQKALTQLKNNSEFSALSASALARSHADWLYGINMTRLCSLKGQQQGYSGVLSVGRVQTPVLGLVVARDLEIDKFVSKPFYEVLANLTTHNNETFSAKWIPSKACEDYCDEEGRVVSKALAENVAQRITNQIATVESLKTQRKTHFQPLPYSLSALQIDASKRYGLAAKEVLDVCQNLYEKHKLITYPRSDCRYLPEDHFKESISVITAISKNCVALSEACSGANGSIKTKAWSNKNVTAHHAIIPTSKHKNNASLTPNELKIYELIARQYLAQFYPVHKFDETQVMVKILTGDFIAKAKIIIELGWKVLFSSIQDPDNTKELQTLPPLKEGQAVNCSSGKVIEKKTSPPKTYTDATLITAMTGIAKHVTDPNIKKILKETDGLGTEATRAGILDLLNNRGFIKRQGKKILSTDAGRALIASLPPQATTPDMTAKWESTLSDICTQQSDYQTFMKTLEVMLPNVMSSVQAEGFKLIKQKPSTKKGLFKKRKSVNSINSTAKNSSYKRKNASGKVG